MIKEISMSKVNKMSTKLKLIITMVISFFCLCAVSVFGWKEGVSKHINYKTLEFQKSACEAGVAHYDKKTGIFILHYNLEIK
jgi:hypothetical protein